jgi:FAD/FMN-containing dehydrogenase
VKPARVSMKEERSFYTAYKSTYGAGDGLLGVGVAISSRLIPRTSLETPEQHNEMADALAKVSEILSPDTPGRNPISYVYHYPLEFLMVTPYNYKPSTDPHDAVSVTPAWRKATWHIVIKDGFANDANTSTILNSYRKVYEAANLFRKIAPDSGAYQNEADLYEPRHEQSFWGAENYARLIRLKKKIDPENLLTCWQCIGYEKKNPRYGCYPEFRP